MKPNKIGWNYFNTTKKPATRAGDLTYIYYSINDIQKSSENLFA